MLKPKNMWHTALFLLSHSIKVRHPRLLMGMVAKSGWKSHHRSLSLADRAIRAPYNDRLQTNIKDTLAVLYHLKVQKSEKTFHGCPFNYHEVRPDLSNH